MRDFRAIRDFEIQWKNSQEDRSPLDGELTGGGSDLEDILNQALEERGLGDGDIHF